MQHILQLWIIYWEYFTGFMLIDQIKDTHAQLVFVCWRVQGLIGVRVNIQVINEKHDMLKGLWGHPLG